MDRKRTSQRAPESTTSYERLCDLVGELGGKVELRRDDDEWGLMVTLPSRRSDPARGAAFTVPCISELDLHAELCMACVWQRPSFITARGRRLL